MYVVTISTHIIFINEPIHKNVPTQLKMLLCSPVRLYLQPSLNDCSCYDLFQAVCRDRVWGDVDVVVVVVDDVVVGGVVVVVSGCFSWSSLWMEETWCSTCKGKGNSQKITLGMFNSLASSVCMLLFLHRIAQGWTSPLALLSWASENADRTSARPSPLARSGK